MPSRAVASPESKSSSPRPVKMCVANDGQREPAATQLVLDRLDELEPSRRRARRAASTSAIVCSTVAIARPIAASSSSDLTRRSSLTRREPVRRRFEADDPPEVQRRLGPDPVADRDVAPMPRATRSKAANPSSVSFTTTTSPGGLLAQVEQREHPRQHEHRVGAGPEERAGHPAVRVRGLAEVRDVALDPGQVLEIGRRGEEERVDALGLEPLGRGAAGARRSRTSRRHPKARQHLAAEQLDAVTLVDAVGRPEVDRAARRRRTAPRPARRPRPACRRTRTAASRSSRKQGPRGVVLPGRDAARRCRTSSSGLELDRRVERADDVDVHRHLAARQRAGALAVLVDDGDGAEDDPDVVVADPLARSTSATSGIGAAADLDLGRRLAGERGEPRRPRADEERDLASGRRVAQAVARAEREALAREARAVAREQPAERPPTPRARRSAGRELVDAERLEPRSGGEPEERAAVRGAVERGDLARDLDRVQRERVEARRPDAGVRRRAGDLEQRRQRGLEPEVVEDRDDVEARLVGAAGECRVLAGSLVGLQREPELAPRRVTSGRRSPSSGARSARSA